MNISQYNNYNNKKTHGSVTHGNTYWKSVIVERRRIVAKLRFREHLEIREIPRAMYQYHLKEKDDKNVPYVNPETEEPWSPSTILEDIRAMEDEWREEYLGDVNRAKVRYLRELDEVKRTVRMSGNMSDKEKAAEIRGTIGLQCKIIGVGNEKNGEELINRGELFNALDVFEVMLEKKLGQKKIDGQDMFSVVMDTLRMSFIGKVPVGQIEDASVVE